jgi:hypothetical protein
MFMARFNHGDPGVASEADLAQSGRQLLPYRRLLAGKSAEITVDLACRDG